MTESYELPVLFTDDECKAYAAWGMKKEKVLMPFALITILIYMVATVLVRSRMYQNFRYSVFCEWGTGAENESRCIIGASFQGTAFCHFQKCC